MPNYTFQCPTGHTFGKIVPWNTDSRACPICHEIAPRAKKLEPFSFKM